MMKKSIIKLENVWKTYKMGDVEVNALHNFNLDIKEGEFVVHNGYYHCTIPAYYSPQNTFHHSQELLTRSLASPAGDCGGCVPLGGTITASLFTRPCHTKSQTRFTLGKGRAFHILQQL